MSENINPTRPTNSLCVAGMVCGILSLASLFACSCITPLIGIIIALVFGALGLFLGLAGKKQVAANHQSESGDGMAIAGIVTGAIGCAIALALLLIFLAVVVFGLGFAFLTPFLPWMNT